MRLRSDKVVGRSIDFLSVATVVSVKDVRPVGHEWLNARAAALAASMLLASCAVGPDFLHPAAPEDAGYTKEPLAPRTVVDRCTDRPAAALRQGPRRSRAMVDAVQIAGAQRADRARRWTTIPRCNRRSPRCAPRREQVYAQEGKFFPLVQANFNPTYQRTPRPDDADPSIGRQHRSRSIPHRSSVSYTLDVWGLNRRTVESLKAQADAQRFQVEAAYLTLTANVAVAAITEASLRGQIDATNELIAINTKMLDILRQQLEAGYANRSDVAAQEAALAQVRATLPPLRKALAQQRDLLAALAGIFPNRRPAAIVPARRPAPADRSAGERAVAARSSSGPTFAPPRSSFMPRARRSASPLPICFRTSPSIGNAGFMSTTLAHLLAPQNLFWDLAGNATQTMLRRRHAPPPPRRREGSSTTPRRGPIAAR